MRTYLLFYALLISLLCPLSIDGATKHMTMVHAHNQLGSKQTALPIMKKHGLVKPFLPKTVKKHGNFVQRGGIGKSSVWALFFAFLLSFFGQLYIPTALLISIVLSLLGLALALAIVGYLIGGENKARSRLVLWFFAIVGVLYLAIMGLVLIALSKRDEW